MDEILYPLFCQKITFYRVSPANWRYNFAYPSMSILAFAVIFCFQFIWTWNDLFFGLVLTERFRPIMAGLDIIIKAHVFLCVLALLVERVAERACGWTWPRIRQELRSIKVAQLLAPNGIVYQTTSGTQDACNLLRKLKIKPLPEVLGVK